MKKTYKNPTLKVVKVKPARILTGSETLGISGTHYNGSTTVEARRSSFSDWDEEE